MTDDDLDALLVPARWEPGRCSVEQALSEIPDEGRRAKVSAGVDNDRVPSRGVIAAFKSLLEQSPPSDQSIRRHRARHCTCP